MEEEGFNGLRYIVRIARGELRQDEWRQDLKLYFGRRRRDRLEEVEVAPLVGLGHVLAV